MATNVKPFAPGYCEIRYNQIYGGATNVTNRWFFKFTGAMDVTAAGAIAAKATTEWNAMMAPCVNTHLSLLSTKVTDLGSASGAVNEDLTGSAGTKPITDFLPATSCIVSHGFITRRYRGGKPRWYQAGLNQSDLFDNQHFTSAFVTQIETALANMIIALRTFTTGAVTMGDCYNLSFVKGYTWTEYTTSSGNTNYRKDMTYRSEVQPDMITNYVTSPVIATQRKRGVN